MSEKMKEDVLAYVINEYGSDPSDPLGFSTPLISGGVLDSFSMVSLKRHLEKKYEVAIPDHLATPEAFDSVDSIVELVTRLKGAR
jgi:acyl carrier protein